MSGLLVFMTDFGLEDAYVGAMKGAALSVWPDARMVDLSHGIAPQDIRQGAVMLHDHWKTFPVGSIFVAVVDPGVGSRREAIAVRTERGYWVGPDNGVLELAVREEENKEIRILESSQFFRSANPSSTFHGRDIFAPVGAHLAKNPGLYESLGPEIPSMVPAAYPEPRIVQGTVQGEVLFFDRFGNAISNITRRDWPGERHHELQVRINRKILALQQTYASSGSAHAVALWNSTGRLEIACPNGSAQVRERLKTGDAMILEART